MNSGFFFFSFNIHKIGVSELEKLRGASPAVPKCAAASESPGERVKSIDS